MIPKDFKLDTYRYELVFTTGRTIYSTYPSLQIHLMSCRKFTATLLTYLESIIQSIQINLDIPLILIFHSTKFTRSVVCIVCDIGLQYIIASLIQNYTYQFLSGDLSQLSAFISEAHSEINRYVSSNIPFLIDAARLHNIPFLHDRRHLTFGYGVHSSTWLLPRIPDSKFLPWIQFKTIPIALITGTNGKTTTARLLTAMLESDKSGVALCCSDGIYINGKAISTGDSTGSIAAMEVLKSHETKFAVLETARGGLLKRGLAVNFAQCAVITNVANDHFGQYDIDNEESMFFVKSLVYDSVDKNGKYVLNLGDSWLVKQCINKYGNFIPNKWVFYGFAHEVNPAILQHHLSLGGEAWIFIHDRIEQWIGSTTNIVLSVQDIRISFAGYAIYNLLNAMAAAALASILGQSRSQIASVLCSFGSDNSDNKGRFERYYLNGRLILLDYGHNAHGIAALRPVIEVLKSRVPNSRLYICTGSGGDRTQKDIELLVGAIVKLCPQEIWLRPMDGRGRNPQDVISEYCNAFHLNGFPSDMIHIVHDEVSALSEEVSKSNKGDLILHLLHLQRYEVKDWLVKQGAAELSISALFRYF